MDKCPGQMPSRDLDSELVTCPSCGATVEIFTDEPKRRCKCGKVLLHKTLPRCAEWCPAAERCFGEAADMRQIKARLQTIKNDPRAKECLERIEKLLKDKHKDD